MAKKATKTSKSQAAKGRIRPLNKKQAREKAKKEAAKQPPITGSFTLLGQSFSVLRRNWRVLGGIVLIYLILNVIFASGLFSDLNSAISTARQSHAFSDALGGYGSLLSLGSSSGTAQSSSSAAQSLLLVLESLVIIWALRQLLAGEKIRVKQAYYHSMAPLVPFLLVILVIIIQLLPLTIGAALLGIVLAGGDVGGLVTAIFIILFALLAVWSVYLVSGSVFSLYIVTLPDMQPRQALRSAKNLVRFRRWTLLRRLFFLPLFVLVVLGVISVPLILLAPFLVAPVFFVLLMLAILFAHTYLYSLYRGLLA